MAERKGKRACSGKCRAALSRRQREAEREVRDRAIRALLEAALRKLRNEGVPYWMGRRFHSLLFSYRVARHGALR